VPYVACSDFLNRTFRLLFENVNRVVEPVPQRRDVKLQDELVDPQDLHALRRNFLGVVTMRRK
jgi:hypothetical protein